MAEAVPEFVDDLIEQFQQDWRRWLDAHGWTGALVINAAWTDNPDHGYMAVGSKVPQDAPPILADSLRESASEVEGDG